MASHNVTKMQTQSYRFSGYQLKRDLNHHILGQNDLSLQLNVIGATGNNVQSPPDNIHPIAVVPRAEHSNQFENQGT
jgi:hypothetical protein